MEAFCLNFRQKWLQNVGSGNPRFCFPAHKASPFPSLCPTAPYQKLPNSKMGLSGGAMLLVLALRLPSQPILFPVLWFGILLSPRSRDYQVAPVPSPHFRLFLRFFFLKPDSRRWPQPYPSSLDPHRGHTPFPRCQSTLPTLLPEKIPVSYPITRPFLFPPHQPTSQPSGLVPHPPPRSFSPWPLPRTA